MPDDAAIERGERIETSKNIARGGKTTGYVPGATPKPRIAQQASRELMNRYPETDDYGTSIANK